MTERAFVDDPPVVGIGIGSHDPDRPKDTRRNITDTRQFVVNRCRKKWRNITAIEFEPGRNELAEAERETLPSVRVKPPRIAGSPVAMECELMQIAELGESGLMLGRVLAMHVREEFILDPARAHIDTPKLDLIGCMHGRGW